MLYQVNDIDNFVLVFLNLISNLKKLFSTHYRSLIKSVQQFFFYFSTKTCNSYTIGCPPVRGDNPRALASGLSYVQVDKHGITILYHVHQCRPCTSRDISC